MVTGANQEWVGSRMVGDFNSRPVGRTDAKGRVVRRRAQRMHLISLGARSRTRAQTNTGVDSHSSSMMPRFKAMVTACVRSFAPSLERILLM